MAAQDKVTFKQDLTEPVKIRYYEGVVFTGDDCGNLIKVALFDGGAPYSGGGTVSATAVLADGTTFPLTHGSITGNMVSVPLEAGALVVSGLMGLYVKISGGGIICTVLNAIFTVQATDTGMVPAAMVTTVNELVEAIRDAQDSIPADLTNLLAAVAPTFSTTTAYNAGAYVWQGGKLYRFTAAHPAGTWTGTDAAAVALGNDVADLKSAIDDLFVESQLLDNTKIAWGNNTAVTNNNDGTFTIGTADNGNTLFGNQLSLTAGDYYLFGVPNGIAYISPVAASQSYNNAIATNASSSPKRFTIDTDMELWVGFRSPSKSAESYIIHPALYQYTPKVDSLSTEIESITSQIDDITDDVSGLADDINSITDNVSGLADDVGRIEDSVADLAGDVGRVEIELMPNVKPVSFNGNYFKDEESVWNDGFYSTATGTITQSDTLQYAYCPIVGAGNYVCGIRYNDFGSNAFIVGLVDNQYRFVKSVTGTRDGDNTSFSLSDNDIAGCKYIVMRRDKTKDFSPKLFYNATAKGGVYKLSPVFGYSSDPLYKKVIACDGDSICAGYLDRPKQYGAWFGRLANNYQVTGHNYAVSGGTIAVTAASHSIAQTIDTIHTDYPNLDYLILEGGTNDADRFGNFDGDTPPQGFGTWSDENTSDYNGNYDNTTFCGAVEELFYKAVTYWPNAKIGFIIPMQMGTLMIPSKRRRRYFDEIIKIAKKWHINVLDLWNVCHADARAAAYYGGTEGDLTKFYYDGQHPTSVGYDLIQPIIEAWMKTL